MRIGDEYFEPRSWAASTRILRTSWLDVVQPALRACVTEGLRTADLDANIVNALLELLLKQDAALATTGVFSIDAHRCGIPSLTVTEVERANPGGKRRGWRAFATDEVAKAGGGCRW
eukprot:3669357-Pyramimonas_sp.AAC.1